MLAITFSLAWTSILCCTLPVVLGESLSNTFVRQWSLPTGPCKENSEVPLFASRPPENSGDIVPLKLLESKLTNGLTQCGTRISQHDSVIADINLPKPSLEKIYNECGAVMSQDGVYVCKDCMKSFPKFSECYFLLQSGDRGTIQLELNIESTGSRAADDVSLLVYEGNGGRNALLQTLNQEYRRVYTPTGASMLLVLRLNTEQVPAFSFSYKFRIEGKEQLTTSGCGGIIRDYGRISSPGYPNTVYADDNCVWIFYASYNQIAHIEISTIELTKTGSVIGSLTIRDGISGVDREIAVLSGIEPKTLKASGGKLLLQYKTQKAANAKGFSAKFYSQS